MRDESNNQAQGQPRSDAVGSAAVVAAYTFWGVHVVYWKFLGHLPPAEVLAHRIVWSLVVTSLLVLLWRRGREVLGSLRWKSEPTAQAARSHAIGDAKGASAYGVSRVTRVLSAYPLLTLTASAALLAVNWGVFVWAVQVGRVVECSMGYFVSPLLTAAMGAVLLRERMRPLQRAAFVLAVAGVGISVVTHGLASVGLERLPWVAVVLSVTWALYAVMRKLSHVESLPHLTVEMAILLVPAGGYLAWLAAQGGGALGHADWMTNALLVGAGPVTAAPLLVFAFGVRRVSLAAAGILQYVSPTGQFLMGLAYGEPFGAGQVAAFTVIWAGVGLYVWDSLRGRRA